MRNRGTDGTDTRGCIPSLPGLSASHLSIRLFGGAYPDPVYNPIHIAIADPRQFAKMSRSPFAAKHERSAIILLLSHPDISKLPGSQVTYCQAQAENIQLNWLDI
jgi:hypothetical protein